MRAYRCDACGRIVLLPSFSNGEMTYIPGEIYIYHQKGMHENVELCDECLADVMDKVAEIRLRGERKE